MGGCFVDDEAPYYSCLVPVAICLETVAIRLENKYYRHLKAVIADVLHIQENCLMYNNHKSTIAKQVGC